MFDSISIRYFDIEKISIRYRFDILISDIEKCSIRYRFDILISNTFDSISIRYFGKNIDRFDIDSILSNRNIDIIAPGLRDFALFEQKKRDFISIRYSDREEPWVNSTQVYASAYDSSPSYSPDNSSLTVFYIDTRATIKSSSAQALHHTSQQTPNLSEHWLDPFSFGVRENCGQSIGLTE
eukprot:sb/3471655/